MRNNLLGGGDIAYQHGHTTICCDCPCCLVLVLVLCLMLVLCTAGRGNFVFWAAHYLSPFQLQPSTVDPLFFSADWPQPTMVHYKDEGLPQKWADVVGTATTDSNRLLFYHKSTPGDWSGCFQTLACLFCLSVSRRKIKKIEGPINHLGPT